MPEVGSVSFPIPPVKILNLHDVPGIKRQAIEIQVVAVGVGARPVEGLHAAGGTKPVARRTGVESVLRERCRVRQELKRVCGHDDADESGRVAHRTVAAVCKRGVLESRAKLDGTAVAGTRHRACRLGAHVSSRCQTSIWLFAGMA